MIAHRNFVKDIGRILFWFPVRWTIRTLPFSALYRAGGIMGDADYLFSGPERIKRMVKNISGVFEGKNKKSLKRIIKTNLQNHCRNVLELIKYPHLNQKNVSRILYFEGLGLLDRELANGKGVILATSHFGAKQLLQVGLGLKGYKINQISYHMDHTELTFIQKCVSQRQRKKIEEKIPARFIPVNSFLRSAYNCLKNNEILIIAADGIGLPEHMKRGYTPFSFLGKKSLFPPNMVSLAKKTGSSLLPVFVVRERMMHKIVIEPAIEVQSKSIEDTFAEFVKILEKYVRQYPSLWEFWEEFEDGNLIVP